MSPRTGLTHRSAAALAALVRSGEASSREIVEAHVRRLEEVQPALNAVAIPLYEKALAAADAADAARARGEPLGPLHGVPITIKESFDVAGTDCTAGVDRFAGTPSPEDSGLVARLRAAGAVVIAKTNVAQLLWFMESDNPLYGRCNNPWDLGRTPGGSSGGEAAVIAAGGSPLGLGSDVGGSVRIPAHFCGIHAIKPTSGRLTPAAFGSIEDRLMPGMEAIISQAGPMARSVEDLSLALRLLLEDQPGGPAWQPPPASVRGMRIGVYTDSGHFPASPALRRAVDEAASALRDAGAEVEPFTPPDVAHAWETYTRLMTADGGACLRRALGASRRVRQVQLLLLGMSQPAALRLPLAAVLDLLGQPHTARAMRACGRISADAFLLLVAERDRYRIRFRERFAAQRLDALVCPPLATPAIRHGIATEISQQQSHVTLYNLLGWPAGVVAATRVRPDEESDRPASRDRQESLARATEQGSAGLPVGVQVAAPPYREDRVLAVMAALEAHFAGQSDAPTAARVP